MPEILPRARNGADTSRIHPHPVHPTHPIHPTHPYIPKPGEPHSFPHKPDNPGIGQQVRMFVESLRNRKRPSE